MAKPKIHAARGGDPLRPLCNTPRVPKMNIEVGGAFKGNVTCKLCMDAHAAIMKRHPIRPDMRKAAILDGWAKAERNKRAKLFGTLRMHINEFAEAKILHSWRGGRDPSEAMAIEAHLKIRRHLLNEHIRKMQDELL